MTEKNNAFYSILLVDDHAVVRSGIKHIIKSRYPSTRCVECENGERALEAVKTAAYDLVFLDISLPDKNGLEVLKDLKSLHPGLPVILLSVFREQEFALRAFQIGADSYLQKNTEPGELIQAIEVTLSGGRYFSSKVARRLSDQLSGKHEPDSIESLSDREYIILLKLAIGLPLKEIAAQLNVSPKTVTTYRSRILEKLNLTSNAELVQLAVRLGLIE